jgi:predicted transcriptional regulator
MKLEEVKRILNANVISGTGQLQKDIKMACGSDLISDVLAFVKSGSLLLTGLTNPQVVRIADMVDLLAICFVRGKKPDRITIKMAKSKHIPLLVTPLLMFESCGRLYRKGLHGCSEQ